jgi:hypothetical protein
VANGVALVLLAPPGGWAAWTLLTGFAGQGLAGRGDQPWQVGGAYGG